MAVWVDQRARSPIVLHTIPLLAATCLTGFAMLQLVFSIGSF